MIAFVHTAPRIEAQGDGFLVTLTSGNEETAFFLTLHALSTLSGFGMTAVKKAQQRQQAFVGLTADDQRLFGKER
jgi:hypothetical protein